MFRIQKKAAGSRARFAEISTPHGTIPTPAFMPVGTQAAVKGLLPAQLTELGTSIVLANTYHLYLRPGSDVIRRLGGLHSFMGWDGPILTDSGGYQVFSLSELRKVTENGVRFKSHLDGSEHEFTPELSMSVQRDLGSDLVMVLDECPEFPVTKEQAKKSMDLTHRWAEICKQFPLDEDQALLGIVQGSTYPELREESARTLTAMEFDGYALGGLCLGESKELRHEMIDAAISYLPEEKVHYLMGAGTPEDIVRSVDQGIDIFDCVLPTRNARNGYLFTSQGPVVIKQSRYREDPLPLDPECGCYVCKNFSRAYLRHLFMAGEINSSILNTYHNVHYYLRLMEKIREQIEADTFAEFKIFFNAESAEKKFDKLGELGVKKDLEVK
ncbi:tRNA guanosine(34) transglycosylase Tgt [bacterium]|nr:tRNA guanosine(34) transglycosylase Tgt [bacterium]